MAETTPELNLFKLSMNPLQNYLSIDITQVNGNGLEVERFSEKNGILDDLDATHKVNILKQFIQCLRRLYQQSITCSRLSSSQITCLRNQLSFSDKSKRTNGIHSLANLYCYALTNEKWQNYSEELPIEDIQCSGHPDIALDILKIMTKNSTNTKEVFLHPFYWSDVRRIEFLCDAYNYINSEIKKNQREYQGILRKFNMYKVEGVIPDKGWIECLRLTVDERSGKDIGEEVVLNSPYRLHNPDSIYDLMRFFRNRYLHRHEETLAVKLAFGGYPVEYLRFFTSRFPNLFMHVYRNMNRYLEEQYTNLEPYLLDDLTILPESFNSSEKEASPDVPLSSSKTRAEGISMIQNYFHYHVDGDIVQGSKTDIKDSAIETLIHEATPDVNECIQTKLNKKVCDFLQKLLPNTDNPFKKKEICSILCEINSVTKSLDTPQEAPNSFPTSPPPPYSRYEITTEKPFREESSGTTALKEPQTNLFDFAQLQDIQQGETPSYESKSVIIPVKKHVYSNCTLSEVELFEIENIIESTSEVDMIEFRDCKIGNNYCTPGESQKNTAKCKISKLIISYTDHFKEFSRFFYSTFGGCEIKSLCLVYANLDDQDVDNLQSFMVKGIESLDISYNNEISPGGFEQIGNMIAEKGIRTLRAIDCDLEKMKLAKLFEGLKNVNLRELDVGYNDNLTENGFEMLAKLVASKSIEILRLRGCQLTEKTIRVFYNTLEKTDEKVLLNELDVSYNPEMNPACCEVLGLIIKKFGITTLNLAGCGISEEHLTSLMSMKDIELHAINLRENSYSGDIMVEIANIVSEFKIQELDISDCMFSVRELKNFRTNLNGTKLQKLHIGDKGCELDMEYIQEVCQLLQTVNEMLYIGFHRLDDSCRRFLNEQSEKLSVSIQLCDELEAT